MDWIKVYKAAERDAAVFSGAVDMRWEAAVALARCGFLKPVETLAASEPLNIPLQTSVLVGSCAVLGKCCPDRLAFVAHCLSICVRDERYAFPLIWLRFGAQELEALVHELAAGLARTRKLKQGKTMDPDAVFFREDDIRAEPFENDLVLLSRRTKRVLTLNETAQVFWDALEFGISKAACCQLMKDASADQSDSQTEAEIDNLFAVFLEHGFIRGKSSEK